MATTKISSAGVTFPDATVQDSASPGIVVTRLYTSPSPWTKPGALKSVKVTALGGGGGGGAGGLNPGIPPTLMLGGGGGLGGQGHYFAQSPAIPGPVTVTVGGGGGASAGGGASSFGGLFSVNGGAAGAAGTAAGDGAYGAPGFSLSVTSTPNTVTVKSLNGNAYGVQGTQAVPSTPTSASSNGGSASGFGYGGGGGRGPSGSGGSGTGGFVVVEEFY